MVTPISPLLAIHAWDNPAVAHEAVRPVDEVFVQSCIHNIPRRKEAAFKNSNRCERRLGV